MNGIFLPMLVQGLMGVSRRLADGGWTYQFTGDVDTTMKIISWSAWGLAVAQLPFIVNFFKSIRHGEKVSDNPWDATTLEWQAPSPPPHGNFTKEMVVYRGPYEYSVPGHDRDFIPQNQVMKSPVEA
jgi:cytochrome c oxidase subunit 1